MSRTFLGLTVGVIICLFASVTLLAAIPFQADDKGSLTGVVTLEGKPQPAARVVAWPSGQYMGKIMETRTDAKGRYIFEALAPKVYQVCAQWGNYGSMTGEWDVFLVNVQPQKEARALLQLVQGRKVTFVVTAEETGEAVANAHVLINAGAYAGRTDDQGRVQFGLPSGAWGAFIISPGFAISMSPFALNQEDRQIEVKLVKGGVLHGTIRDGNHQGLEGVKINALFGNEQVTDAQGHFTIDNLELGSNSFFQATKVGYAKRMELFLVSEAVFEQTFVMEALPTDPISGRVFDTAHQPIAHAKIAFNEEISYADEQGQFELVPSAEEGWVSAPGYTRQNFKITPGSPLELILKRGFSKSGVVRDAFGHGLAAVVIFRESGTIRTDEQGRFQLDDLDNSEVLSIFRNGYRKQQLRVLEESEELVVVLDPLEQLKGRAVDKLSGEPISSFSINEISYEDAKGQFSWFPHLGNALLQAPGYKPLELDATQGEGEFLAELMALEDADSMRIAGRVIDSQGEPIAGCNIHYLAKSMAEDERVQTDSNGAFVFKSVLRQKYLGFELEKTGYGRVMVNVSEGQGSDLEIVLKRALQLEVEVNLERYPDAAVVTCQTEGANLNAEGKARLAEISLDIQDIIRIRNAAGRELVSAAMPSGLEEGQTAALRIGFGASYQVAGQITIGSKEVVQGYACLVGESTPEPLLAEIDPSGFFRFEALPEGVYNLFHFEQKPLGRVTTHGPFASVKVEVHGDLEQRWRIPHAAKVVGSVHTPTPGWRVELGNVAHELKDDTFCFSSVRPGRQFRLEAYRFNGKRAEGRFLLAWDVYMPRDGSDLNLGNFEIKDGGMLRVIEKHQREIWMNLIVTTPGPQSVRVEPSAPFLGGARVVNELPEGPVEVELESDRPTYLARPNKFQVTLSAGKEVALEFETVSVSYLQVNAGQLIESASMEDSQGVVINFKKMEEGSKDNLADGEARLAFSQALARGLAPGKWTFSAKLKDGTMHIRKLELSKGQATEIDLESN